MITRIDEHPADGGIHKGNGLHRRTGALDREERERPISSRNRPTTGWRSVAATVAEQVGKPSWAPNPSRKEVLERERRQNHELLLSLTDEVKQFVLAVFNFKGGAGKTPVTAYLSSLLSSLTGVPVAFIDGNPGSTSPGLRMGMWSGSNRPTWAKADPVLPGMFRKTATIWELFDGIESGAIVNGRDLSNVMRQNHDGVATLLSDTEKRRISDRSRLTVAKATVGFVSSHIRFTFIDTGNDYTTAAQQVLAELSTDLLFPAYVRQPQALNDLAYTMSELSDPRFGDKVSRSIVVMTGIDPKRGATAASYGSYVGEHTPAKIIGIPYDPAIEYEPSVRLDLLRQDTKDAMVDVLIAVMEQNLRAGNGTGTAAQTGS